MSNEYFDFKQFSIKQDRCAMKVGTDGVLLGAFVPVPASFLASSRGAQPKKVRVLDIGTGTGLIALMIAQRLAEKGIDFQIDALEIDLDAAQQAEENVADSPWGKTIHVIPQSLHNYSQELESSDYDLIVSNPPFYNATLKPEDEARATARHKDALPLTEITQFAQGHLTPQGQLHLIYPMSYDTEVLTAATLSSLHPITFCDVVTKKGKPCKRRMATFALPTHPQKGLERQLLTIRNEENEYSEEYLALVKDYYLFL